MLRSLLRKQIEITPGGKVEGVPPDAFIVLNVNRNQTRKRLDLTAQYFCEWVQMFDVKDAFLMVHSCPTGEEDFDIKNLMEFYGQRNRLLWIEPEIGYGIPEAYLSATYNLADIQISTTMGEGFGLTTLEGMACGIPQIVPDFSALGEICGEAAIKVPCATYMANRKGIDTIGGIADRQKFIEALQFLYAHKEVREEYSRRGKALAADSRYRWESIGAGFQRWMDIAAGRSVTEIPEVVSA
jgi:glycosyltransferase involved in cell wall biosynthesis